MKTKEKLIYQVLAYNCHRIHVIFLAFLMISRQPGVCTKIQLGPQVALFCVRDKPHFVTANNPN